MKRKINLIGQLSIQFSFDEPQQPSPIATDLDRASRVIQKYLQVADRVSLYYDYCSKRTPLSAYPRTKPHPMMQRYYNVWHLVEKVGRRAVESLGLECVYFFDVEARYNELRCRKGKQYEAHELRRLLDGFGFIQQVFDHHNHTEERYLEDGDEFDPDNCEGYEDGKPIGYWYWSFEDHISRIPVPKILLTHYIEQYEQQD